MLPELPDKMRGILIAQSGRCLLHAFPLKDQHIPGRIHTRIDQIRRRRYAKTGPVYRIEARFTQKNAVCHPPDAPRLSQRHKHSPPQNAELFQQHRILGFTLPLGQRPADLNEKLLSLQRQHLLTVPLISEMLAFDLGHHRGDCGRVGRIADGIERQPRCLGNGGYISREMHPIVDKRFAAAKYWGISGS